MFGVAEDAVYDPAAIERDEQQRAADALLARRAIFVALLLFAPGAYWFLVVSAWAPIPYLVALTIADRSFIVMAGIGVAFYTALYWWASRLVGMMIAGLDRRWARLAAVASILFLLVAYALSPGYQPISGYDAPHLNLFDIIRHAFGPQLSGVC